MRIGGWGRDSPIALGVAAKLYRMGLEIQLGQGTTKPMLNGPEGPMAVAKEHGELGVLQDFVPGSGPTMIGGGRARNMAGQSREPNSTGLSDIALQMLGSDELKASRI